jgi:hypothetical protein
MLRQFARCIPIVERLRVGFAAAGTLGTLRLGTAALSSVAGGGAGGTGGHDDLLQRFQTLFAEARDEIEYAREDAETTYFNESVQTAKQAVDAALSAWQDALNNQPDDSSRAALVRGSGLKVEQLKAELQALDEIHA